MSFDFIKSIESNITEKDSFLFWGKDYIKVSDLIMLLKKYENNKKSYIKLDIVDNGYDDIPVIDIVDFDIEKAKEISKEL